jgi:hypothetical protein
MREIVIPMEIEKTLLFFIFFHFFFFKKEEGKKSEKTKNPNPLYNGWPTTPTASHIWRREWCDHSQGLSRVADEYLGVATATHQFSIFF